MFCNTRIACGVALALVAALADAAPGVDASFAGLADSSDGRSLDLDLAVTPLSWLEVGGGVGSTKTQGASNDLDGTSLRAMAEVHSDRFGLRGYYRNWNSNHLDTDTAGGRAFYRSGGLTLSLLGERRGVDLDYSPGASAAQHGTAHFNGAGWGGGVSYAWSRWSIYGEGTRFRYGSLSRFIETTPAATPTGTGSSQGTPSSSDGEGAAPTPLSGVLPTLPDLPALPVPTDPLAPLLPALPQAVLYTVPTLSGSYVTLNQGVFDHLLSAGIGREFERSWLHLDWTGAKDAVLDTTIDSFSAGYRYSFTERLNAGVTLGVSRSRYGSVNFGGLSFGLSL